MKSIWLVLGAGAFVVACGGGDAFKNDVLDGGTGPDAVPVDPCTSNLECQTETAPICQLPEEECRACAGESDCSVFADAPLCASDGACVACRDSNDCSDPNLPTCDADSRTCRACTADNDCASGVCDLGGGFCVDASMTYVVDDDAICGRGDGSEAKPFCKVDEAIAAFGVSPRNWVVFRAGTYVFPPLTTAPLPNFVTPAAARIVSSAEDGDCVYAASPGGVFLRGFHFEDCATAIHFVAPCQQVEVSRTTIKGGEVGVSCAAQRCVFDTITTENTGTGVFCSGGATCIVSDVKTRGGRVGLAGDVANFQLERAQVVDASDIGLHFVASEILVQDSTVTGGGATAGVACAGSFCGLERVRVSLAKGPGLVVDSSDFEISSSAFFDNDRTGVVFTAPGSIRDFEGNTVVGNRAEEGSVGGVACGAAVDLHNSIVWGNQGLAASGCTASYSNIDLDMPGEGNINVDCELVSLAPGAMDVHLSAGSPCVDTGDPVGGAPMDFERESRPAGRRIDIGADELSP